MNKKVMLYFTGLVWIAVLLQLVVMTGTQNDGKIVQAFHTANSVPAQSMVRVRAPYQKYLIRREDCEKLCRYIASGMEMNDYQMKYGRKKVILYSQNETAKAEIALHQETTSQTVVTTVTLQQQIDSVIGVKEKIEQLYKEMGMKPEVTLSIQGTFEGEMDKKRCEALKTQIFKVLETRECKRQYLEQRQVYYGYSQRLPESKTVGKQKINVQLIFAKEKERGKTRMYLAVPFYNQDF